MKLLTTLLILASVQVSGQSKVNPIRERDKVTHPVVKAVDSDIFIIGTPSWNMSNVIRRDTTSVTIIIQSSDTTEIGKIQIHGDTMQAIKMLIDKINNRK